jgi:arabinogalactan endo-1,4-beta-galactosidase
MAKDEISTPDVEDIEETGAEVESTEKVPEKPKITWTENFHVKADVKVDTVDRLEIHVGVNEYKGSTLVFLAKVTDQNFSRQFFSMPAYLWEKTIAELQKVLPDVAKIEKASMVSAAAAELKRLKELGIDIDAILAAAKLSQ